MKTTRLRKLGLRISVAVLGVGLLAAIGATAVAGVSGKPSGDSGGQSGTTLNAYKTADGFWVRRLDYDWSVTKQASPSSLEIQRGETRPVQYTITATRAAPTTTDIFSARGQVCVTNGGGVKTQGLKIVDQVQYQTGGGPFQDIPGATQTIVPPLQLLPGATGCYDYEVTFTPVSGATYRNVASVTITNHSGYLGQPWGPAPKADFALPSSYSLLEVDKNASVNDVQTVPAGLSAQTTQTFPVAFTESGQIAFTKQVTNTTAPCGVYLAVTNRAALTEGTSGQTRQSSAQVVVYTGACPTPTPIPTATPVPNPTPPPTPSAVGEGCTPGYWKNHTSAWVVYSPSQLVTGVFPVAAPYVGSTDTLLVALDYKGGKNVQGAAQTLLRSAVAALLNTTNPTVDYPRTTAQVLSQVSTALLSGDRNTMLSLASTLDTYNNLRCPLR